MIPRASKSVAVVVVDDDAHRNAGNCSIQLLFQQADERLVICYATVRHDIDGYAAGGLVVVESVNLKDMILLGKCLNDIFLQLGVLVISGGIGINTYGHDDAVTG